jgi:hypothetical protein
MFSRVFALVAVATLVLFVGASVAKAADDTKKGTFVSVKDGKLTFTDDKGKDASFTLGKEAKITLDGKPAKAEDLKAGVIVTLTMVKDKDEIAAVAAETKKEKDKEVKDKK